MSKRTKTVVVLVVLLAAARVSMAQSGLPSSSTSSSSSSTAAPPPSSTAASAKSGEATAQARPEPCWQQAGIPESVMEAHRNIMAATRAEVASVCNDPALSQPQRVLKIRQIHQEARGKMAALVTPDQEQAMNACRAERSQARRAGQGAPGGGGGAGAGAGAGGGAGAATGAGFGGGRGFGGGGFDCASLSEGTSRQHASPSVPQQRPQQPSQQPGQDQDPD